MNKTVKLSPMSQGVAAVLALVWLLAGGFAFYVAILHSRLDARRGCSVGLRLWTRVVARCATGAPADVV
jgi:hypothetical protein